MLYLCWLSCIREWCICFVFGGEIMNEQRLICGVIVVHVIYMLYICNIINSNHYGSSYRKKTDSFSFGYRSS